MGQVTIYLDDDTEKRMTADAKRLRISKSKWITNVIREKLVSDWPDAVRDLPGSWEDFPDLEDLRTEPRADADREAL